MATEMRSESAGSAIALSRAAFARAFARLLACLLARLLAAGPRTPGLARRLVPRRAVEPPAGAAIERFAAAAGGAPSLLCDIFGVFQVSEGPCKPTQSSFRMQLRHPVKS